MDPSHGKITPFELSGQPKVQFWFQLIMFGPIVQKLFMSFAKFNPFVRLRGTIFVNTKYRYKDFCRYVYTSQIW